MGRYSKNLSGQKAAIFIGPANVEYTTDATFALFIANAVEGEIGIYTSAGVLKTTALAANEEFFIVQKKDGELTKTPILKYNEIFSKRKTAYDAPVKKVMTVGYGGSTGSLNIDFTGASATTPLEFGIAARETTPGNQPFPVQEGYAVVTSTSQDEYALVASIVTQLNFDVDYEKTSPDGFVKAEILSNGTPTYLISTIDPTVTNGSRTVTYSAAVTVATGAYLSIRGAIYKVATGVTAGTTLELDRPYQGTTETIDVSVETTAFANTITYTSGTTELGIKLTGLRDEVHFVVTPTGGFANATVTVATAWKQGAGAGANIVELEAEGVIFQGLGSTVNAAFASDYGQPTKFASATGTYDQYFIDIQTVLKPSAAAPLAENRSIERIHIAVPSSGTTPSNELTTILAV
jgi:hypothetical protein